jgi:hypothetical protein
MDRGLVRAEAELEAYSKRHMNKLMPSICITDPAFIEGRAISAFALNSSCMRPWFHGHSPILFPATASSRR